MENFSLKPIVVMQVQVDGEIINLEVLDTAGQDEFRCFRDAAIGSVHTATGDPALGEPRLR